MLVLSQYVEQLYARELLADGSGGVGYLLKDRVSDVGQFVDAVRRVAGGGTAMDPEVVAQLLARNAGDEPLAALTPREREVLALMAEGRSNAAIAGRLFVTERAVGKHTTNIFAKLGLPPVRRRQPPGAGRPGLPERVAKAAAPGEDGRLQPAGYAPPAVRVTVCGANEVPSTSTPAAFAASTAFCT